MDNSHADPRGVRKTAESHRQVPVRTRVMLADRAQAIGAEMLGSAVA